MATLDEILEAIPRPTEEPRPGAHSQVYEALWGAYDALVPHLDPPRRPNWQHVASKLAARGIRDGDREKPKPPTGERTRKAWWKVGRDKDAVAAGTATRRRRRRSAGVARDMMPAAAADVVPPSPPQEQRPPKDPPKPPEGEEGDGLTWAGPE